MIVSRRVDKISPVDRWDHTWAAYRNRGAAVDTPQIVREILALGDASGRWMLEVGCGSGGDAAQLAAHGARITTLDFSREALALTRQTAARSGATVHPVLADARMLPFRAEGIDVVYHQGLLEHFVDPAPLVAEQRRVLRPGGHLIVDVPQRFTLYAAKKFYRIRRGRWFAGWERSFSIGELRRLVRRAGFAVARSYGRGYSPNLMHRWRRLEGLWSHRPLGPAWLRRWNEWWWQRFETSHIALLYFKDIGVVCRKALPTARTATPAAVDRKRSVA